MLAIVIRLLGYRKETERVKKKGLRILAAAAVLTFGCLTMNAYAAEGWALSNNIWTYLDKNGNRVTNEWKKGADNLWRYLNNSGEMAVNSWADNDYYVDANGIMVADKWMQIVSPYSRDSQTYWFTSVPAEKSQRTPGRRSMEKVITLTLTESCRPAGPKMGITI